MRFWPVKRPKQDATPREPDSPALDLVETVQRIASDQQALRLEWAETMDRINQWARRTAARDRKALQTLAEGADGANPTQTLSGAEIAPQNAAEARAAQKAELRRRYYSRGA